MKMKARMIVTRDGVVCPKSCQWRSVEECLACKSLRAIERRGTDDVVVCEPALDRPLGEVLQGMIRV